MPALDFATTPWTEVEARLARPTLAVLPLGAVEQHGAHLPLTVDADLALGVARAIADPLDALLLPAMPYGDAWNNAAYPGTLSLSPATLQAAIVDIGEGLRQMGVAGLIILNGHFGNHEPMLLAARRLSDAGLPCLHLDYPGLGDLAAVHCDSTPAAPHFYHADEVETSMMLALRPDAVRMEAAAPSYPTFPPLFGSIPMQLREFNPTGVFGDPRPATAEKGHAFIAGIAANTAPIISAFLHRNGLPG
ncbi:creatinine amidohydrolase [Ketogulonicigenium robustum]|uniref:Creatinine amidohydrolase n=1 Tax=Ketogulonicigenium robustum TaxID=92947 RepID=A0A1W6NY51_9RHOB|nr:creatininase family protein [Ketogulonicigenium robustum]ARO14176.1 creatinine amidohydrolase [Ketogulonicigenium robustum]